MNARASFRPVLLAIKIGAVVLLVVDLLGFGIPAPPVQGMDGQSAFSTETMPQVSAAVSGPVAGTLASFTALIPELSGVYLPLILK
jgi:hypothetical protein